jgi:hypothetical protein
LYWKWACIIFERAANELSRLEGDLRVEKQKRHELLMAKDAERAAKEKRDRREMAMRSNKRPRIDDSSELALTQRASRSGLKSFSTGDGYEELTRMMARWHL